MRSVKKIHQAVYAPIANLVTYRALPTQSVEYIDPFLFLNHHGPQVYPAHNSGLPFGPHPHRGMETVTFIIEGDIAHKDSSGHESVIKAGGIQWMRAGRGLIHAEVSSNEFKQEGGPLEILQLWVNLPAKLKMAEPFYIGKQKDEIPVLQLNECTVTANLISGQWKDVQGAFESETGIFLSTIHFKPGAELDVQIPEAHSIFFYVITGEVVVNGTAVRALHLAEFDHNGDTLTIQAKPDSMLLLGHAMPFNEPVVSHGPFVMNTQQEIKQAYDDYNAGKFGYWDE
ncbi:pirin family protein [Mucilaginibacter terrae]|uniref:Redox-sensitive bicupin YhaK (Pirin superfamily) n=1 Tax=Mucilaginibacter terrae TaxID=1955052 RepID=A0ABU3GRM0_9SPHI|nr:pirin family protein [Mucilaginibacter terrae]MDT3402433.1 redox-sensitive bicupin YhaK (pirin superfamily) [Mucilaginibacter terrae]